VLVAKALDQRKRLHAACTKAGATIAFARVADHRAAATWVGTLARERGHRIASAAVEDLLARTGTDLARIDDELEKLSLHAGPAAAIDASHVGALVSPSRSHAIDELSDRIARGDGAGAIHSLRGLVAAGEAPLRIVAFLAANLRRALHVTELVAGGLREDEVATRLGMPPWLVGRNARRGKPQALEQALGTLAELDVALKSSRSDQAALETAMLALTAAAAKRPG
jgi:DNA polymerase-3 subunit delta